MRLPADCPRCAAPLYQRYGREPSCVICGYAAYIIDSTGLPYETPEQTRRRHKYIRKEYAALRTANG